MKFENTDVWGFEHAIRGMRNPLESWSKSDSSWHKCNGAYVGDECHEENFYVIGKNDLELAQKLVRSGSEHRKFMRQIFVSVDITAPMYWWSEFDTYKVGTVANSTSKMHKLASTPITKDCFEMNDYENCHYSVLYASFNTDNVWNNFIDGTLEPLRMLYNETKDKKYWKELIRLLPESWLQKRTVTMDYENLLGMCGKGQRRFHKLNEWSGIDNPNTPNFIGWARKLPYAGELIFIDETEDKK